MSGLPTFTPGACGCANLSRAGNTSPAPCNGLVQFIKHFWNSLLKASRARDFSFMHQQDILTHSPCIPTKILDNMFCSLNRKGLWLKGEKMYNLCLNAGVDFSPILLYFVHWPCAWRNTYETRHPDSQNSVTAQVVFVFFFNMYIVQHNWTCRWS